jgi:hypothetical protein
MKKLLIFGVICACLNTAVRAQDGLGEQPEGKKGFDKSRLFIGGNFGLSFGDYTIINVSPQLGYHFTEHFAAGAGISYIYYNLKTYYTNDAYQRDVYSYAGINVFGRYYPIRQFFIQAQPELNYVWGHSTDIYGTTYKLSSTFVPSLLLGGGASIPAGRGAIMISVLYDVLQNTLSPYYHQAVYGLGYNIGF